MPELILSGLDLLPCQQESLSESLTQVRKLTEPAAFDSPVGVTNTTSVCVERMCVSLCTFAVDVTVILRQLIERER